jgi:ribosomal protein S18 acetylase RimI-like enzyme
MSKGYEFKEVVVTEYWEESQALTKLNYDEVEESSLPLVLNKEVYVELCNSDLLHTFVVLKDKELIGYTVFLTTPSLHHMSTSVATCDVIFVKKEHRRGAFIARDLIRFAETELQYKGVEWVFLNVKTKLDFSKLLERVGYNHVEKVYSKHLEK